MTSTVVFTGGSIYTMDLAQPWAQCLIIEGDHITDVGRRAGAPTLIPAGAAL